jgi:hypothetical protein
VEIPQTTCASGAFTVVNQQEQPVLPLPENTHGMILAQNERWTSAVTHRGFRWRVELHSDAQTRPVSGVPASGSGYSVGR